MAEVNYYFIEFEDYLKALCIAHTDIEHNDASNIAFIRLLSEQDDMSLPSNAAKKIIRLADFTGQAKGSNPDEMQLAQFAVIDYLVYAENVNNDVYEARKEALKKAMQLLFDFYNRMVYDMYQESCGALRFLQPEQMSFDLLPYQLENHYGWTMTLPFKSSMPSFNQAKWSDLP